MAYSEKYFEKQKSGSQKSAEQIVPLVLELIQPTSVVDVGCGVGAWLKVFSILGVKDILGLDGSYIDQNKLQIPKESFMPCDFTQPIKIQKEFDLAICLEVAEHLPEDNADQFIEFLTDLSPVILFSAATPFQGGHNHVNEQWPEYWYELFKKRGYVVVDALRRRIWNNQNVEWWYAQNIMFFVKEAKLLTYPKLRKELEYTFISQLSLVHPRSLTLYKIKAALPRLLFTAFKKLFRKIWQ